MIDPNDAPVTVLLSPRLIPLGPDGRETWTQWHTGGGCMALRREFGDSYALMTSDDGCCMPDESDIENDSVFVGVYCSTTGESLAECGDAGLSLADAIAFAERHAI